MPAAQVCALRARLSTARRVVVLGNGGIALELVHALRALPRAEVVWAVRDGYIGNTFFDASASAFAMPELDIRRARERSAKRHKGMSSGPNDAAAEFSARCECSPDAGLNVASTRNAADCARCCGGKGESIATTAAMEAFRRRGLVLSDGSALGPDWLRAHRPLAPSVDASPRADSTDTVRVRDAVGDFGRPWVRPSTEAAVGRLEIEFECELNTIAFNDAFDTPREADPPGEQTWRVLRVGRHGACSHVETVAAEVGHDPAQFPVEVTLTKGRRYR